MQIVHVQNTAASETCKSEVLVETCRTKMNKSVQYLHKKLKHNIKFLHSNIYLDFLNSMCKCSPLMFEL